MMRRLPIVLMLITTPAWGVEPGLYLMSVGGKPILVEVTRTEVTSRPIAVLDVVDTPLPPKDPTDPDPSTLTPFATQVRNWANQIGEPSIAGVLSQTFGVLADKIESREIQGVAAISDTTRRVVDVVVRQSSKEREWTAFRGNVGDELAARAARGELATITQYAGTYREIRDGLAAASPGAAINLGVIVKLVLAIISKDPDAIVEAIVSLIEAIRDRTANGPPTAQSLRALATDTPS